MQFVKQLIELNCIYISKQYANQGIQVLLDLYALIFVRCFMWESVGNQNDHAR